MLALTRKKGEAIIIGDNIELIVLGVSGEQVKLGIVAPREITVHRKEIYEQIQTENLAASQSTKPTQEMIELLRKQHRQQTKMDNQ